jgi:hypothetical protein
MCGWRFRWVIRALDWEDSLEREGVRVGEVGVRGEREESIVDVDGIVVVGLTCL